MLRRELNLKTNIDIKKYPNLIVHLKRHSYCYQAMKSKILLREHIVKFMKEADGKSFLMMKVNIKEMIKQR